MGVGEGRRAHWRKSWRMKKKLWFALPLSGIQSRYQCTKSHMETLQERNLFNLVLHILSQTDLTANPLLHVTTFNIPSLQDVF